ncbi:MAG TPA: proteasome accessory factor PafA2 family protein [Thermoplasmata archaeon]|nr:proteasome accessory factor PafA2 family protein [Thermoplasmata archaeon]
MRPFIQGTEHEYTFYSTKMHERNVNPHLLGLQILHEKSDLHAAGEFTVNQSRAYHDVGHFEVSTPEVTNAIDLVVWEKAGEKMVDWSRRKVEELYFGEESELSILSLKNNTAPDGTSYGSHENYCVPRGLDFPDRFVRELAPHLITRIGFTGAGDLLPVDDSGSRRKFAYALSPSAFLTGTMVSSDTMHNTGVLNTRDEPHADARKWRRLHIQVGDALMNEVAIALRHFSTTCVLTLMEQSKLDDVPVLTSPLEDMWAMVETMNPDKWTFRVEPHKFFDKREKVGATEIQRYYLMKSESLVESVSERKLFKLWEQTLDWLDDKRTADLHRRVEWLDRYLCMQEKAEKRGTAREGAAEYDSKDVSVVKRYSETGVERSHYYEREKRGEVERLVTDEQVAKAIMEPPRDTRAWVRKCFCDDYDIERIDWAVIRIKNSGEDIELDDPFSTVHPRLGKKR